MIIDLILDRYHGDAYDPKKFYDAVMDYEEGTEYPISRALDGGEEEDVKRALCDYIDGEYNPNIKKYINAVEWLKGDDGKDYSKEIDILAENKQCSMQKKIESLFKTSEAENPKDVMGNELPYGMMQYRDEDTKEWLPILVSINYNDRGWFYDGLAPTDNLGNFGYDEFSRGFLKTCKSGTDKCDQELVKSMKKFFADASMDIDKMPTKEVTDLTAYIPKGIKYIGKE